MESQEEIKELFSRYIANECSVKEVNLLLHYFNFEENETLLKSLIKEELDAPEDLGNIKDSATKTDLENIFDNIKKRID